MDYGIINIQTVCILMAAFPGVFPATVFWQLGQEVIELGKPLILQCTIVGMDHIPADKSRQWTGEINNRLFTFNGVSTCPSNYTEILEPPNSFKIFFNSTSMFNLNSPYTCRVGTMFDEKILTVNVSNFVYMPTRRTTKLLESNNGSYRMHFNIEHVYPKPTCRITTGKICSKHNRSFNYAVRQLKECQSEKQSHGSQVTDMVFVAISALLFVLLLVYTIHAICKRKKLYDNNTNYRAVSLDTETNDVAFHIQRSLT
ncbi:unnamed protein product [Mytilus coruscus]|uniref:Ig-like domain-containing protein n=1 Tax=Mytilus coruscus TaxID=42192 RepID=A0A6J8AQX4_MYTCO|nr:unnamed protein product [Mytilus coruscus]